MCLRDYCPQFLCLLYCQVAHAIGLCDLCDLVCCCICNLSSSYIGFATMGLSGSLFQCGCTINVKRTRHTAEVPRKLFQCGCTINAERIRHTGAAGMPTNLFKCGCNIDATRTRTKSIDEDKVMLNITARTP